MSRICPWHSNGNADPIDITEKESAIPTFCKAVNAGSIPAPASNLRSIDDMKALVAGKRDYRASEAVHSLGRARLPAWPVDAAGEAVGRMS